MQEPPLSSCNRRRESKFTPFCSLSVLRCSSTFPLTGPVRVDRMADSPLSGWLLASDPTLRWQVERDVLGAAPDIWEATRARIATEGFGAQLLARQDSDGQWAGGAFFPADFDFDSQDATTDGQPWT